MANRAAFESPGVRGQQSGFVLELRPLDQRACLGGPPRTTHNPMVDAIYAGRIEVIMQVSKPDPYVPDNQWLMI